MKCLEELKKEFNIPEIDEDSQRELLFNGLELITEEEKQFDLLEKYTKLLRDDFDNGNITEKYYYDEDNKDEWEWKKPGLVESLLINLCDRLFITSGGRVNYDNKFKAEKEYEVRIYPGDQDSFGWLTGVYQLRPKLYILFG